MEYRKVPKTGEELSAIGYGCMRLPSRLGSIDETKAEEQFFYAISQGVNYFDTAYPYHNGNSEKFIGKFFSKHPQLRQQVKIATKLPPWAVRKRSDMDRIFTEQLERLQSDYVDYYLVHGIMDQKVWDRMKELGIIEFLDEIKASGRAKNIGFSFHSDIDTFKNIIGDYDWSMCQIQYNYLDETIQAGTEGLKYAAEKDIAVVIMEPLRGGNLAGKMPAEAQKVWNDAPQKRSAAEWALRWIWNHGEVTCVLSGMNEEAHIRENIKTAATAPVGHLSEEELSRIGMVKAVFERLVKVPCTGCSYCMPCPAGVNIPGCFSWYNSKALFGGFDSRVMYIVQMGGLMDEKPSKASQCIGCGKCETHCPQHIEIRQELKNVSKSMEGIMDRPLGWLAKRQLRKQEA
jgi:predicted aldo/keto reductase-like oxidoreductase